MSFLLFSLANMSFFVINSSPLSYSDRTEKTILQLQLPQTQAPLVHLFPIRTDVRLMMNTKKVFLLILFQGMVNVAIFANEEDSTSSRSVNLTTRKNMRLKGHVVKQFESPSLMSCSHSCLKNAWCASTNFKEPSRMNGKGTCELNKHETIDLHTLTASVTSTRFHEQQGVTFLMLLKVKYYCSWSLNHLHLRDPVNIVQYVYVQSFFFQSWSKLDSKSNSFSRLCKALAGSSRKKEVHCHYINIACHYLVLSC